MNVEIKYSPKTLDEVIYPNQATALRVKGYGAGHFSGHVMFHGPRGTAKTTTARLLIEAIGGPDAQIENKYFEDLLRMDDLKGYLQRASHFSKFFLLLNEFDNANTSLHKLWNAMDDLGSKLMVVITTNEPIDIHPSIRSRSQMIEFPAITATAVLPRAQEILKAEGLNLPNAQILSYLKKEERHGDLRKYMATLNELLYINQNKLNFPTWSGQKPNLTLASK